MQEEATEVKPEKKIGKPVCNEKQCSCGDKRVKFVNSFYINNYGKKRLFKRFFCFRCKAFYSLAYHEITKAEYKEIMERNKLKIRPVAVGQTTAVK